MLRFIDCSLYEENDILEIRFYDEEGQILDKMTWQYISLNESKQIAERLDATLIYVKATGEEVEII